VLRKGELLLIYPSGEERTLVALGSTSDTFRIGEEEHEPEWIRFDAVVNQHAETGAGHQRHEVANLQSQIY
jgi:hypothetical protein